MTQHRVFLSTPIMIPLISQTLEKDVSRLEVTGNNHSHTHSKRADHYRREMEAALSRDNHIQGHP
jgi:hypothetical protein